MVVLVRYLAFLFEVLHFIMVYYQILVAKGINFVQLLILVDTDIVNVFRVVEQHDYDVMVFYLVVCVHNLDYLIVDMVFVLVKVMVDLV